MHIYLQIHVIQIHVVVQEYVLLMELVTGAFAVMETLEPPPVLILPPPHQWL